MLNNRNLQTIYEKGDQNLTQMQQLEDLSAIIRKKDNDIIDLNEKINDLEDENRQLHTQIRNVKEEHANKEANRGMDMLQKSSMAEKLMNDPKFMALQDKLNKK